jgi:hypothetical protein
MSYVSFIGGIACKTYDDFYDNNLLKQYRNDKVMEFLKGLHYISFTATSLEDPLFSIILYIGNFIHSYTSPTSFIENYESSLGYSFGFLLLILNYKKITDISLKDKVFLVIFVITLGWEPILIDYLSNNSEYSFIKLISRTFIIICCIIGYVFSESTTFKNLASYTFGYGAVSLSVQLYSLFINKNKELIKNEEPIKNEESTQII